MEQEIAQIVSKAVKSVFGVDAEAQISPAEALFGDFSTNIAFMLVKTLKKAPGVLAMELAAGMQHPNIVKVESAGSGYVNITMTTEYWVERLGEISSVYGSSKVGAGKKLQVEFISANPTGPLTIGNARGGFTGDVLSRVLQHQGYDVVKEYYFNDAGTQVSKLVESVKASAGLINPEKIQYQGPYINSLAEEFKQELNLKSDKELGHLLTQAIFKKHLEPAIKRMGVSFDVWFNERDLFSGGGFRNTLGKLKQAGLVYEKDGATWLASHSYDPSREDRVLIKSNGDVTYLGNDLAYHLNIFQERGFDIAIKLLGPDHVAQFPSLQLTIKQIIPEKELKLAMFQWVRLIKDGKEVKVSKRAGNVVTVDDLIDDISADVARFFFLMRSAESQMDFDLDLAKEQSQKNPYWYIMYSYVRANSILAQAKDSQLEPGKHINVLNSNERALVKQMAQFPKLISLIAQDYGVHRLAFYGLELARLFHEYYESTRIIVLPREEAAQKLYLLHQFTLFMQVYFSVLGITPIEKM